MTHTYTAIKDITEEITDTSELDNAKFVVDVLKDDSSDDYVSKNISYEDLYKTILDMIYPVGCVYVSTNNKPPNIGQWKLIETGCCLWTDTYLKPDSIIELSLPPIEFKYEINGSTDECELHEHTYRRDTTKSCGIHPKHHSLNVLATSWTYLNLTTENSHNHDICIPVNISVYDDIYNSSIVKPIVYTVIIFKRYN